MAEPEHVLRAILTVYVDNEEKYVQGTGALTALLARLTTAEAERDEARTLARSRLADYHMTNHVLRAAEARVEALSEALRECLRCTDRRNEPALCERCSEVARAALACPPQGAGPGCKNHRGDPHNLCEACWALEPPAGCPPPESSQG